MKFLKAIRKRSLSHILPPRLKIDESDAQIQKLLREMKESNPQLTIESDHRDPKDNRPSSHDFIFWIPLEPFIPQ